MSTPQATLARRVFAENRKPIIWLAAGLVINVLVYAFGVYPLSERVANVTQRNDDRRPGACRRAPGERAGVRRPHGQGPGGHQARHVLHRGAAGATSSSARQLTHLRLAQLARMHGLRYGQASSEPVPDKDSKLTQLKVELTLGGSYAGVRAFLHDLETAPQFVVIDNVVLAEERSRRPRRADARAVHLLPEHAVTALLRREVLIGLLVLVVGGGAYVTGPWSADAPAPAPPRDGSGRTRGAGRRDRSTTCASTC